VTQTRFSGSTLKFSSSQVEPAELLEQVNTYPYLGSLITDDGECTTKFRTMLNKGQAIGASLQKIWKSRHINFNENSTNESASMACRLWKLDSQKEWRNTSWRLCNERTEKILWVSWTANKTNEWVLRKPGVKRELLDMVKTRKLTYYSRTMRKQWSCLEKQIMQGTMAGARMRGRHIRTQGT